MLRPARRTLASCLVVCYMYYRARRDASERKIDYVRNESSMV